MQIIIDKNDSAELLELKEQYLKFREENRKKIIKVTSRATLILCLLVGLALYVQLSGIF